jgi:predicted SAM-dependent methyltransferase
MIARTVNGLLKNFGYEIKRRTLTGPDADLALYRRLYGNDAVETKRFYNVGAGRFVHPAWTNVDKLSDYYTSVQKQQVAINWDLLKLDPLPVEADSAELVYTSHTIEHVTDKAAENFFCEAYRILKPGGFLRITCPDVDLAYRAVLENDRDFFYWIDMYSQPKEMARVNITTPMNQASVKQVFLYLIASSVSLLHGNGAPDRISDDEFDKIFAERQYEDALDHCTERCPLEIQEAYPQNHINWWNEKKIMDALTAIGFKSVYRSGGGQSNSPPLRNTAFFDNTHPKMSLYVEAKK